MGIKLLKQKTDCRQVRRLYLLGNPNVGKSTVFNAMTGLKQHTGNWSGKTVDAAMGKYTYNGTEYILTDLPGTHSVLSEFSEESVVSGEMESAARGSVTLILADASALKRGVALALEFIEEARGGAVLCINFCDIAAEKGIEIDFRRLSALLGIPVIGITAKRGADIKRLKAVIDSEFDKIAADISCETEITSPGARLKKADKITEECVSVPIREKRGAALKIDKILTSAAVGIPVMIIFLGAILWLTIRGANYPSELLSRLFGFLKPYIAAVFDYLPLPRFIQGIVMDGVYDTVTWIIAVMLPPMAIFFPLFTLLEDAGFLPRIAFNLDKCYARCGMSGKQCLTQCMGLGCNAVGVCGCRIMPGEKQRAVAVITNSFMPCNGRFAILISLSAIFVGGTVPGGTGGFVPMLCVLALICLSAAATWAVSGILTKTLFKDDTQTFALELPEYRRPEIIKTLGVSLVSRTLRIVGRALLVSAPTGAAVWLLANITLGGAPILTHISHFFDPFGRFLGVDGFIILAFILSLPANEITLPILIMSYTAAGSMADAGNLETLRRVFEANGWTIVTAVNMMLLTLFHWPCATTLMTIYHETKSRSILALSFITPCLVGMILCLFVKCSSILLKLIV